MGVSNEKGGSRWVARYEVMVDPQVYPRVHGLLQEKGAFSEDFSKNLERLAHEYLSAVEAHLDEQASSASNTESDSDASNSEEGSTAR